MKLRILALGSAASVALLAGSAFAADLPVRSAAPAPVVMAPIFTWTGFYVGVHAGYGWGDADYSFSTDGHYNNAIGDAFGHSVDGWLGGAQIGYNLQINQFVLGLEGSISATDLGKSRVVSPYFASDRWSTDLSWTGSITARLGVAFGSALVYAKGGFAFGDVETRVADAADYVNASSNRTGWTLGAGVEYAFSPNWSIGLEYMYTDLGSFRVNREALVIGTNAPAGVFTSHSVDTTFSAITARLNYRFGGGYSAPVVARY